MCLYRRRRAKWENVKLNYFEQIEAMHQQVREYVEKMEPKYKVAEIEATFTTSYKAKRISPEEALASLGKALPRQDFILTEIKARFRVNAYYIDKLLDCEILVMSDGNLYLADQKIHIWR
jgi:NH3-dependent NAD+ synthetase